MVGGIIYRVEDISETEKWVGCIDTYGDKCGVICETRAKLRPGDKLWWQAGCCFWTPSFQDERFSDISYPKIGGSGVSLRTARENREKDSEKFKER